MGRLVEIITSEKTEVRNQSLDSACQSLALDDLISECAVLENFRHESDNLYHRVRALFFLYAMHRFHIPFKDGVSTNSIISYKAYEHMLKRRFEEAIRIFIDIQEKNGPNEGISSGLADAYHQLAFQTLADQVRKSVKSTYGNQWMFRISHPDDHPLKLKSELLKNDDRTGLFPLLHESTPVRMDITHCGWSDIFFLGMDFPKGAQVFNISVDLCVRNQDEGEGPRPPIETFFRVIDEPVLKLTSVDLGATASITKMAEVFDFAKDYLGLLKAAVIASGIVPPAMEGSGIDLPDLLSNLVGPDLGIEIVSKVNNIPKGSRLAVSTNLLASLISICMRATGQTKSINGELLEEERRLVAARAILGEWIGGSGGGWQDSGGVWPGIKIIKGVEASVGDPEYGISNGRLLPRHTIMDQNDVSTEIRQKLQDSLVMVHGGMAQDVGPILEMVTEKHLLRSEQEWKARHMAIHYFDEVIEQIKSGDIQSLGKFTEENFKGPIQAIIPWTSNIYTEILIKKVREEFGENFWGFWMMGGMSGGGMGFMFDPKFKEKGQEKLQQIMSETKSKLENAVPFAMEPVVYDFQINEKGTFAEFLEKEDALMPIEYYTMTTPALLKKDIQKLTDCQRNELELLSQSYKNKNTYQSFMSQLLERMMPQSGTKTEKQQSLDELLKKHGFDEQLHQQIKSDLKATRIGLAQNRLPVNSKIIDVKESEVLMANSSLDKEYYGLGSDSLKKGEVCVVTLAGGVGSRWSKGAGVVKSLNPYAKLSGKHRNFIETHLAKSRKIANLSGTTIPHVFTTSYLTHQSIGQYLEGESNYHYEGPLYLSEGKYVGLRLVPTEKDLRFLWEELPQQVLDEQAQKMQDSLRNALINWAKSLGEGEDYRDNLPHQCIHPVGHWFEIPNMLINGTLKKLLDERPQLKYIFLHNIDTLGANVSPEMLGLHIRSGADFSTEVITRKLDDRGGGLANIDGKTRLIEGLALPDEQIEFDLTYYNSNTFWINIDSLFRVFELTKEDLDDLELVKEKVNKISRRMPTYITIKDVKKRWGKGQEDIFPVTQFEKLWGDMTALSELNCKFIVVPRMRGQQLKEVDQLDGWLRDGSAKYVEELCEW
mgnify:CR=1 FL=1